MLSYYVELFKVKTCIVRCALKRSYDRLCGRLRCSERERRNCCVNDVAACFDSLESCHRCQTCCVVCVKLYWKVRDLCFESLNELFCRIRFKKTCHILDTDRVNTHINKTLRVIYEILCCIARSCCIRERNLNVSLFLLCSVYSCAKVSFVVKSVENTNDIDTVCYRLLYEVFNNVVSIVAVSEDILSSEKHLKLCVLYVIADNSKTLPGVFVEEAQAGVEGSAAPSLERVVSNLVKSFEYGEHFLCCHTSRNKGLV